LFVNYKKAKFTFWNTCSFFFIFFEFPVPGTEMNGNLLIVTVTKDENFTKRSRMILSEMIRNDRKVGSGSGINGATVPQQPPSG
jgi:hypothetical protein